MSQIIFIWLIEPGSGNAIRYYRYDANPFDVFNKQREKVAIVRGEGGVLFMILLYYRFPSK